MSQITYEIEKIADSLSASAVYVDGTGSHYDDLKAEVEDAITELTCILDEMENTEWAADLN